MFQLVYESSRLVYVSGGRRGRLRGREGKRGREREGGRKGGREEGRENRRKVGGRRGRKGGRERERRGVSYTNTTQCRSSCHGTHQVHVLHIKPTNQEENVLTELLNVFVKWTQHLGKPVYQF